jgi:DNA-directed RNA polymerase subunit RPC12/RpoP
LDPTPDPALEGSVMAEGVESPGLQCPRCGDKRLHRSHSRGVARVLARALSLKRYRCHGCGAVAWKRLHRFNLAVTPKRRSRILIMTGLVVVVGLVTGLTVVYSLAK